MRAALTLVAIASLSVLAACPGKQAGGAQSPQAQPALARTYEALRWVPADSTWVIAGKRADDVARVLRESGALLGILEGFTPEEVSAWSNELLRYDVTSPDSLASIGLDVGRGVAVFGSSLSITVAAALADPAKLDAFVDGLRASGLSLQSQIADGAEVFTSFVARDVTISWTVVDGWVLARLELREERQPELAWLEAARAARAGFAASPDLAAAIEAARTHAAAISAGDGPPVVGVAYPGKLVDAMVTLAGGDGAIVDACLAPVRDARRVLVAAGVGDAGATGAIVADLADAARWQPVAGPAGWYAARDGAPVQLELGLDLQAFVGSMRGCTEIAAGELGELGVRTVRLAAHEFARDGMPTRAAAFADLSSDRALRQMIGEIPLLDQMSKRRRVGDAEVVDVSIPFGIPPFSFHLAAARAFIATGDGVPETILGAGAAAPAGELLHVDLRPHDVPEVAWRLMFEALGVGRREVRIRGLQRWDRGVIDVRLDGTRLVLTATGTLRP